MQAYRYRLVMEVVYNIKDVHDVDEVSESTDCEHVKDVCVGSRGVDTFGHSVFNLLLKVCGTVIGSSAKWKI